MEGAHDTNAAQGEFRKVQNFIGPSNKIEDAVNSPLQMKWNLRLYLVSVHF